MTVTDQIKILIRKIKQNESQYDLDRKAAEKSALPSNNLDKYEYQTGKDLGLKPSTVFNKGLSEEDKKEGLQKKLKNIKGKNDEMVKIKNKTENIKEVTDFVKEPLSLEAKDLVEEIRIIQKDVDHRKLIIRGGNNFTYNFSYYKAFKELFRDLYYKKMTINDAEMKQNEFNSILDALNNYSPKAQKYIEAKNSLLNNAKNFYKGREKTIEGFKERIFPLKSDDEFEQRQTSKKPIKADANAFNEWINKKETSINRELFENYFHFKIPSELLNIYTKQMIQKKIIRW